MLKQRIDDARRAAQVPTPREVAYDLVREPADHDAKRITVSPVQVGPLTLYVKGNYKRAVCDLRALIADLVWNERQVRDGR